VVSTCCFPFGLSFDDSLGVNGIDVVEVMLVLGVVRALEGSEDSEVSVLLFLRRSRFLAFADFFRAMPREKGRRCWSYICSSGDVR
jgi:hypothetical protein